ncbi:pentapeptide repeat-containing protein [Alicyclobacillus sp. SO9]|uniref:pentapeptide repeat-containing protein n=1 Tax=Alicyclobacillus sp. SO9 TaxID=2665646 RepID=UPI0018E849B9|nr:pentapeptide repeat-containing protein [Alicyclobacillus sp. SO9]QQE78853.1 pentapeptide repeat-containing protein [Alicyclobacillus sp. SO9]
MTDTLREHLDKVFSSHEELKTMVELKEELLQNLQERMQDLKEEGYDDETALEMTVNSIGEVSELIGAIGENSRQMQQAVGMNLSMSNLENSDLRQVTVHDGKFNASNLRNSDFSGADLSESSFKASNLENVKFDGANLTRTKITAANLKGASFKDARLDGTDFSSSNLSSVSFDGLTLNQTVFNKAGLKGTTFKNATLMNVSFKTNVKKADFDGAVMDKLTYAILQGYGAKLENVTVE